MAAFLLAAIQSACAPRATSNGTQTPIASPAGELLSTPTSSGFGTPSLVPDLSLGYDCSLVERLQPDSAEAQKIVQEFITHFKEQWPTEYMAFEVLWAVDRLGKYAVLQGMVTSDEKDAIVVLQTPQGYQMASRFIVSAQVRSRYTIPEYFVAELPGVPPELFYCMDVSRLVDSLPEQELDLSREYDCLTLESVPLDSPQGQAIVQVMLDFERESQSGSEVELGEMHSVVQLEPFLVAQARFLMDGRLELPKLFILESGAGGYQVIGVHSGPTLTRTYFLREVYAEHPSLPPELLACLDLAWFLAPPAPNPTSAASVALGRRAAYQAAPHLALTTAHPKEPHPMVRITGLGMVK